MTEQEKIKKYIEDENRRLAALPKKVSQDKYCYRGTKVLKNKLHITSQEVLKQAERKIVGANLTYIQLYPVSGRFDIQHLKDIHYLLFGNIYDFAGHLRDTELSKNGTNFCRVDMLEDYLEETLRKMRQRAATITDRSSYVAFLAYFYSELNMAHPFRDGNGRTLREFMRQFVQKKNDDLSFGKYELLYSKMDKDRLLEATIYSVRHDTSLLEQEFDQGLMELQLEKQDRNFKTR